MDRLDPPTTGPLPPALDATAPGAAPAGAALEGGSKVSTPEDRRRRRRRPFRQPGWLYRQGFGASAVVGEVTMRNVSPDGAGFVGDQAVQKGEKVHLKIGLGPTRRPKPAEVVYVRPRGEGRFDVGVRFIR